LKTFIVAKGLPFEKIHDLVALLGACQQEDTSLIELKEECELLNPSYIETRYPVHWPINFTRAKAEAAKTAAETIRERIGRELTL